MHLLGVDLKNVKLLPNNAFKRKFILYYEKHYGIGADIIVEYFYDDTLESREITEKTESYTLIKHFDGKGALFSLSKVDYLKGKPHRLRLAILNFDNTLHYEYRFL